jgi:hypothetical protein
MLRSLASSFLVWSASSLMISAISDSNAAGESVSLDDNVWLTFHNSESDFRYGEPGLEDPESGSWLENMAQSCLSCSRIDEFEEKCACAGRIVK